jgi:hypothetical protein
MNCCRETTQMGLPPGNSYRGIGFEAYLNGTPQGPTPEDAGKGGHIIRARSAPLSPASGFPVSWSQQVIHGISGLYNLIVGTSLGKVKQRICQETKYSIYTSRIQINLNSLYLELDPLFAYNDPDTMSAQDGKLP